MKVLRNVKPHSAIKNNTRIKVQAEIINSFIKVICIFNRLNEAKSNYFYPGYFDEISCI